MKPVTNYLHEQYELVRNSREVLFDYCRTIAVSDFLCETAAFGRGGSIRNLLVHIANVYEFWIGQQALRINQVITNYGSIQSMEEITACFGNIDKIVYTFIDLDHPLTEDIGYEIKGVKGSASKVKILTHVFTHEFHHKGQVLSLSRQLGYIPVDTDIVR